jgi:hypothetical protein
MDERARELLRAAATIWTCIPEDMDHDKAVVSVVTTAVKILVEVEQRLATTAWPVSKAS